MTTDETGRRPPGRPRRYARGRINTTVRFTPARYEDLKASAIANGRSISEEVEVRVERGSEDARMREFYRDMMKDSDARNDALLEAIKLLNKRIDELMKGRNV